MGPIHTGIVLRSSRKTQAMPTNNEKPKEAQTLQ